MHGWMCPCLSSHLILALALNTDLAFCKEGVWGESVLITVVSPHLGQCMGQNRCSIKNCGKTARTYQEGPRARNAGISVEGSHTFPFHLWQNLNLSLCHLPTRTDQRQQALAKNVPPQHHIIFLRCVCMCARAGICACVCARRPERDIECLPLSLSLIFFFFEAGSLSKPGAHWLCRLAGWLAGW